MHFFYRPRLWAPDKFTVALKPLHGYFYDFRLLTGIQDRQRTIKNMRFQKITACTLVALLALSSAGAGKNKRNEPRPAQAKDNAFALLQRGIDGYSKGEFSSAAVIFNRLLTAAAPVDSQMIFLGVYYGLRCCLASGEASAADSLFDSYRTAIPESQQKELAFLLGRQAAADKQLAATGTVAPSADKVGVVLPLSGQFGEFGSAILEGIKLAAEQFDQGREERERVSLEVLDDQSNPVRAAALSRGLAADSSVAAIIGSYENETSLALALVAASTGVPAICPIADAPGLDNLGPLVHVLNRSDPGLARSLARFAVEKLKIHTFAILASDDERGSLLAAAFVHEVHASGGVIVSNQRYSGQTSTFENQMSLLQRYLPDGLFLTAKSDEITQLASQVHYYGLSSIQLLGLEYWDSERVIRMGADYVDGAIFTTAFYQSGEGLRYSEFKQLYESRYRRPVNRYSAYGYDAASLVLEAAGSLPASREKLSQRLNGISEYAGAMASYSIDKSGQVRKKSFVLQLLRGEIIPARPAESLEQMPEAMPDTARPGETAAPVAP